MKSYEGIFVFPPVVDAEQKKAQVSQLENLVTKAGGKITQTVEWGKKSLGYAVKKFREGNFIVVDFEMNPAKVGEFRKSVQLLPEVIKFMLTVKDVKIGKTIPAAAAKKEPVPSEIAKEEV